MKLATEVTTEKLRGGFYTPPNLVAACLDRVQALSGSAVSVSVFEPTVGDGAFLRGLDRHTLAQRVTQFVGVEIIPEEAEKARETARDSSIQSTIYTANAIEWSSSTTEYFDVAVGNPPFVRFQFLTEADLAAISQLGQSMGIAFRGVSNLWIPVLLGSLSRLRPGGVMAFVVPAELFTGVSASVARAWLLSNFEQLRIDLFEPGSFPCVLQEVVVLSGMRVSRAQQGFRDVQFVEHFSGGSSELWNHSITIGGQGWTRYLLTPGQIGALSDLVSLPAITSLGDVARIEVSIVTGANEFFSVNNTDADQYNLHPWLEPLLPRIRYALGLVYTNFDHDSTLRDGAKGWLLNFSIDRPDPMLVEESARYLALGEASNLHLRYKTSIRAPWYRVPSVWSGKLLLSKRSHWYPRLVLNEANVFTTDTIYRGSMLPVYAGRESDLVAMFHNSLTLLSAELEGRSFGGGVLELVPSEIARLKVPFPVAASEYLEDLDGLARLCNVGKTSPDVLVDATDELLIKLIPQINANAMDQIRGARRILMQRRIDRN